MFFTEILHRALFCSDGSRGPAWPEAPSRTQEVHPGVGLSRASQEDRSDLIPVCVGSPSVKMAWSIPWFSLDRIQKPKEYIDRRSWNPGLTWHASDQSPLQKPGRDSHIFRSCREEHLSRFASGMRDQILLGRI